MSSFLRLQAGEGPLRWSAIVDDDVVVGDPATATLYGGAGLGFALQALERSLGRPVICATAQFLAFAYKGAALAIEVVPAKSGYQITQAQAHVRSGDEDILVVTAALGTRPGELKRQWAAADPAPPPAECPPIAYHWQRAEDDMHSRLEVRVVPQPRREGSAEAGPSYWIRGRDGTEVDTSFLAVLGDFVPTALGARVGPSRMSSLDNTIRIAGSASGEWVLCRTTFFAVSNGLAHGAMLMFDEGGTLLASASQSMIVRV